METLVKIENNQAITNSLLIAEKFGKRHADVIRSIENLISANAELRLLFISTTYIDEQGKNRSMYIMNRDGFSLLVMGFTGEKALRFKLDFINAFNEMEKTLNSDEYILMRSRQILENKVAQLEYKSELQEKELQKQAPKVEYFDRVLQSENTYNINLIAKELGMSGKTLNKVLYERGIQYKQGGVWILKSQYQNKGYTKTKTVVFRDTEGKERTQMQTVWTEQGRVFIHYIIEKIKKTA